METGREAKRRVCTNWRFRNIRGMNREFEICFILYRKDTGDVEDRRSVKKSYRGRKVREEKYGV